MGLVRLEVSADGLSDGIWPLQTVPRVLSNPDAWMLTTELQGKVRTGHRQGGESQDPTYRAYLRPSCGHAHVQLGPSKEFCSSRWFGKPAT